MASTARVVDVNQLGGTYINGRSLFLQKRHQIIQLADQGIRACDISRQLKVSHGCVSKILSQYKNTGSFQPRHTGGSKPRVTTPVVVQQIIQYKQDKPKMLAWDIQERLIAAELCTEHTAPSGQSISRILKGKINKKKSRSRNCKGDTYADASDDMHALNLSPNNYPYKSYEPYSQVSTTSYTGAAQYSSSSWTSDCSGCESNAHADYTSQSDRLNDDQSHLANVAIDYHTATYPAYAPHQNYSEYDYIGNYNPEAAPFEYTDYSMTSLNQPELNNYCNYVMPNQYPYEAQYFNL